MESLSANENRLSRYRSGNYAKWFIQEVVAQLEHGACLQEVVLKYDLKRTTLTGWIKSYASAKYKSRHSTPTAQMRNTVVRAILAGRMTMEEAKAACHIKADKTIKLWVKDYQQQENIDLADINQPELAKKKSTSNADAQQEKIHLLQQQLADEKLRVAALNTLIDVAEEQLKINIRKKPGARQS